MLAGIDNPPAKANWALKRMKLSLLGREGTCVWSGITLLVPLNEALLSQYPISQVFYMCRVAFGGSLHPVPISQSALYRGLMEGVQSYKNWALGVGATFYRHDKQDNTADLSDRTLDLNMIRLDGVIPWSSS
jgi:hypothetical protein